MPKRKHAHGGRRSGAGRPRGPRPLPVRSVRMSPEHAKLLRLWGGGDLSAGLRWLIDAAAPLIQQR
jgi:hypothetical protein